MKFFLKFIDPEAISKQLTALRKALITEKIEKIKKIFADIFKSLEQSFLKLNDPEAISKTLTALIKH